MVNGIVKLAGIVKKTSWNFAAKLPVICDLLYGNKAGRYDRCPYVVAFVEKTCNYLSAARMTCEDERLDLVAILEKRNRVLISSISRFCRRLL